MVAHCSSWRHRPSDPPPRVVSVAWVFRALERATTVSQDSRNGWVRAWWVLVRACYCVPVTAWVIKLSAAGCGAPGGRLGPKVAARRLASPVVVESGREPYPLCGPEAPTGKGAACQNSPWRTRRGPYPCNGPSAGAPTETLFRLLLPQDCLSFQCLQRAWSPSQGWGADLRTSLNHPIGNRRGVMTHAYLEFHVDGNSWTPQSQARPGFSALPVPGGGGATPADPASIVCMWRRKSPSASQTCYYSISGDFFIH